MPPILFTIDQWTPTFEAGRAAVDVVCAGDSLTGWNNFGPHSTWPFPTYPDFLQELCQPLSLRIANGGIAGEISDNGPQQVRDYLGLFPNARYFVISMGANDLGTWPDTVTTNAQAQHMWWNLEGQTDATCVYGEITVLATNHAIYYCGANWHPGEPAGGYCGIQHNSERERRTIFSIWDTSPELHPKVTAADPKTIFNRFGGEGEGAHTHMLWSWKVGDTFQFFVQKQPGQQPDTTDARYYIYDRNQEKWLHSATITCPNGGKKSVSTIGGGMNSFLENFAGRDKAVPKLALYRLWLGPNADKLKCLTRAGGDGIWGQLHGAYFLAEGDKAKLDAVFAQVEKDYGKPVFGGGDKKLDPIPDKPVPAEVVAALKHLPSANAVNDK